MKFVVGLNDLKKALNSTLEYEVEYHFENDEEVEVNLDDLDESDVVVDRGQIDLAPVVLALFYDAIPLSYHQEDVKPHSDSYEVISEEEYLKRKKEREKANSPFANIDIE